MKNIILIVVAVVIVVLVALFFIFGRNGATPATTSLPENEPQTSGASIAPNQKISSDVPIPAGDFITIGTSGGAVAVKNFYKNALAIVENSEVIIKKTPEYELDYSLADGSFAVTILKSPAAVAVPKAEGDLISVLDISRGDACKLSVKIVIPAATDPQLAGIRGLSFCAKGIQ
jgi:hypothetical protein